jgi:hypothetical protein
MWDFINFKNLDETASYIVVVKIVPPGRKKTETTEE